jgi:release factor H-coupled RctB family protein
MGNAVDNQAVDSDKQGTGFSLDKQLPSGCRVRVVAGARSWIEGEAVEQLEKVGARFGMKLAVGLPDLHPGRGHPIGAVFLTEHAVYPALVDNDIGCGMAVFRTGIPAHFREQERWARRLEALERPLSEEELTFTSPEAERAGWRDSLGTIGGGNHFAELLRPEEVYDAATFAGLGLEEKKLVVLVHSGSRGLGESILRAHVREHGDRPLTADTGGSGYALDHYLARHDEAVAWARDNRRLIGERFLRAVRAEGERVLDLVHNSVERRGPSLFLHRKGAAPADKGVVVIPGSRGAHSYLVRPTEAAARSDLSGWSLAHGAGRRWKRSDCKGRLTKYTAASLEKTALGSRVICTDKALLFEEAPQAYKDVEVVVEDLVAAGLVTTVARLAPVLTFKTARGQRERQQEERHGQHHQQHHHQHE